jgi:hypothetical protein
VRQRALTPVLDKEDGASTAPHRERKKPVDHWAAEVSPKLLTVQGTQDGKPPAATASASQPAAAPSVVVASSPGWSLFCDVGKGRLRVGYKHPNL